MIMDNNPTDYTEKLQRCRSYMESLEAERKKIQVFERELPLCLELVTQAIEGCRQQMSGTTTDYFNGHGECSEQTSSEGPVLEEFIPLKSTFSTDEDEHHSGGKDKFCRPNNHSKDVSSKGADKLSKKSDWLRSVQLCTQASDPSPTIENSPRKVSVVEVKKNGSGAFHPFKKDKCPGTVVVPSIGRSSPPAAPAAAASSTAETGGNSEGGAICGGGGGGGSKNEDKEGQSNRKARRCWSPELHRRFLQSLQQLGGAHVATPKQIRELMKVDGLTNDEVKSHLQKYRLHTRRPSPSIHSNHNAQTPQFVVVGGIWMQPAEYAGMATTTTSGDGNIIPNAIYTPRASLPSSVPKAASKKRQKCEKFHSVERGSLTESTARSDSPATSSSTHTTTASPAY